MIWTIVGKIMTLAGLFLLLESGIASGQIFQWTDVKGVIHFTDNPSLIPQTIRNSPALIVRKDLNSNSYPALTTSFEPLPTVEVSSAINPLDAEARPTATTVVNYAPQEVIVVVNSNSRQAASHPCNFTGNGTPAFRPDSTDRRYIHPSVFDGASRPYTHR